MHSLENRHYSPVFWQKRQALADFKRQKPMFEQLMSMTRDCMRQHPELENDVKGAIGCETVHPQSDSSFTNFNFHTHPHGDIDYPSPADKERTNFFNKEYLLIGLASKNKVVVYHKSDNFERKLAEF
jgi:hypothetical protein